MYVEPVQKVTIDECISQSGAISNLARMSDTVWGGNIYDYDSTAGAGVTAYIIDTGIHIGHSEFGGRASWGTNKVDSQNTDCNGHGTHVAGTVGSATYGVAKLVSLVAVKVLNCQGSGSFDAVIAGMDWVASDCTTNKKCTANMSLGGSKSKAVNDAVTRLVQKGVTLVVAAGNNNANVNRYSPASATSAITVAATTTTNNRASFSNFGPGVDIFAPGVNILSTWIEPQLTNTISGTSMASPHVCGLASILRNFYTTPAAVDAQIKALAQNGVITYDCSFLSLGCNQTPNKFVQNGC
jgi:subtilisin family serine protease